MLPDLRAYLRRIRRPTALVVIGVWLAACAAPKTTPATTPPTPPAPAAAQSPPEWRAGDRWVYDWKSGTESGTKTVEVLKLEEVNKIRYYVVRVGDVEHYYTLDLHWAAGVQNSRVVFRMVPPQPWFVWPLEVGRRWTFQGAFEDRDQKRALNDTFTVAGSEPVEVPAGRFTAVRVVRTAADGDSDQYWYAPELRFYAKWVGRRGPVEFTEQLRAHVPGPRLVQAPLMPVPRTP